LEYQQQGFRFEVITPGDIQKREIVVVRKVKNKHKTKKKTSAIQFNQKMPVQKGCCHT